MTDIATFNAQWLQAWTDKDVTRLLGFYAETCRYFDPQTPQGLTGHAELGTYLRTLFGSTPPMTYRPDAVWPTSGGFCGRWFCFLDAAQTPNLRGFDLVLLEEERIVHNEVYVHALAPAG